MARHPVQTGFTLLELSIVLTIVALLAGGLLLGLSAQRSNRDNAQARQQLDDAREALLGFAVAHGRLPCPAGPTLANTATAAGQEDCKLEHGVLPWATLALPEIDPWGQRFTYFASSKFSAALPAGAQAAFTLSTGIAPDNAGTANIKDSAASPGNIAADLPAVVVCHGSRGAGAYLADGSRRDGAVDDELENADADQTFIAHLPGPTFDDLLTWLPPSILKARMLAAGRLP